MRWLLLLAISCFPAFGACAIASPTPFNAGGIHLRTNISYDATVPSGQTCARTIGGLYNPTSNDGGTTPCTIVIVGGKGWNGVSENFASQVESFADNLTITNQCATYVPWYSWPAGMQVVASHSIGDTSLVLSTPLGNNTQGWTPNASGCIDGCAGISVSFTAQYGSPGAGDVETVTVTAQGGTNNLTWTINGLAKNHGANEYIYTPKTEYPSVVADLISFLNWCGANCGKGTYPGNPLDISIIAVSSGTHVVTKALQVPSNYCLATGCGTDSWWGSSIGFNGGSSNTASLWAVKKVYLDSVVWDINYLFNQATSGTPSSTLAQSVIPALLGCIPGTDTGCAAFATAASAISLPVTQFNGSVISTSGDADFTTPACPGGQTWSANKPCPGNQYQISGRPYLVFTNPPFPSGSTGHGSDLFTVNNATGGSWPLLMNFLAGASNSSPF